jgi:hypothetical protein
MAGMPTQSALVDQACLLRVSTLELAVGPVPGSSGSPPDLLVDVLEGSGGFDKAPCLFIGPVSG